MPDIEVACLEQLAVLYRCVGRDSSNEPLLDGSPLEVPVRWDLKQTEGLDAKGGTIVLDGTVDTDRAIPIDSIMRLGCLADLPRWQLQARTGDPDAAWYQVKQASGSPDIKGRESKLSVMVMRYRDRLPAQIAGPVA